jgi:hypothetical protein
MTGVQASNLLMHHNGMTLPPYALLGFKGDLQDFDLLVPVRAMFV